MTKPYSYDSKCFDLAKSFISDDDHFAKREPPDEIVQPLAQHIQDEIEGWLNYDLPRLLGEE